MRRVSYVARRYRKCSPAVIDDLTQETYLRLCRNDYRYLRSLREASDEHICAYIRRAATHTAEDYFSSIRAQKRGAGIDAGELSWEPAAGGQTAEEIMLLTEVESCLDREVEHARDRAIYRLCRRQGFSPREIAEIPEINLSVKGVESCIRRIDGLLRAKLSGRAVEGDPQVSPYGGER